VDEAIPAATVTLAIQQAGAPEATSVRLFDLYRGEQVTAGRKSLAYALELRSPEGTLTDDDAARVRDRIVDALSHEFGAELRA
jgi:phenylalanyl-tRNA synthetase beta chain